MDRSSRIFGIVAGLLLLAGLQSSPVMTWARVPAAESDWPTFRGNAARTGVAAAAPIDGRSTPSWQISGLNDGFTNPVIATGVVALGTGDRVYRRHSLNALDVLSGEFRWTVPGESGDGYPATIADGDVYTSTRTVDESGLGAFDLQTGQERWSIPCVVDSDTSLVVSGEAIYVTASVPRVGLLTEQALLALDARTGEERWRVVPGGSEMSSSTLDESNVYVSFRSADLSTGSLIAIDAVTGQTQWLATTGIPLSNNTWPVAATDLVFVSTESGLQVFDAMTGTEQWRFNQRGIVSAPAVSNGVAYIGTRDGKTGEVIALDAETGQIRWQADARQEIVYPPIIVGSVVIAASDNGHSEWSGNEKWAANLSAFDAVTGKTLGEIRIGDYVKTELIAANGSIFVGFREDDRFSLRAIPLDDLVG